MKMPRVLTGIILACGLAGTAQADILSSGPVYGGASQIRVACQVFNAGSIPITFVSTEIFDQLTPGGGPVTLDFSNCVGSLAPNDICTFQAPAGNQAYGCKVNIVELKTDVRGTMAALGPLNALLSEADLR
jgi:hypothetical protein